MAGIPGCAIIRTDGVNPLPPSHPAGTPPAGGELKDSALIVLPRAGNTRKVLETKCTKTVAVYAQIAGRANLVIWNTLEKRNFYSVTPNIALRNAE